MPLSLRFVDTVNAASSDANPGTQTLPWKTIRHAADVATPGMRIIVNEGDYPERVVVIRSGKPEHYISFAASGTVSMNGFQLSADCISVTGFAITDPSGTTQPWQGGGIWVDGDRLYIAENTISNFNECAGIEGGWNRYSSDVHIRSNTIFHCNKGIDVYGINWLVEKNRINRLYRGSNGGDADNFRFFGRNIVIRENIMFGTIEAEIGVSHVDLFQTFDNNGEIARDVLIEKNIGIGFFHQGIMFEGNGLTHSNVIFHRNVFVQGGSWGGCIQGGYGVHFINNTIFDIQFHGIGYSPRNGYSPSGLVKNNIIAYSSSSYWATEDARIAGGWNCVWNCANAPGIPSRTDMLGTDPFFNIGSRHGDLTIDDMLGPDRTAFTGDDGLALKRNSPLRGRGEDRITIGAYVD